MGQFRGSSNEVLRGLFRSGNLLLLRFESEKLVHFPALRYTVSNYTGYLLIFGSL